MPEFLVSAFFGFLSLFSPAFGTGTFAYPVDGGTGTSTAPSYGQVLVGNASGVYDLVATSSLGIAGGSGTLDGSGSPHTLAAWTDSDTLTATSSPSAETFTATSTTATSTFPRVSVQTALNFFGTFADSLDDLCVAITGGADLCDGSDDGGAGTSAFEIATTSDIAIPQLAYFTKTAGRTTLGSVATGTASCAGTLSCSSFTVIGSSPTITGTGLASYDAWTHPIATQSATTSHLLFNGNASSTLLSAHWLKVGQTASTTIGTDGTVSVSGGLNPASNDGAAIGTTALGWSDLHLASGGVINWVNGEVTLTETSSNLLTLAGSALTIANGDLSITNNGSVIDLQSGGIRFASDNDGQLAITSLGNGFTENLTLNLDDTADTAVWGSGTGVTNIDWSAIGMVTTGLIDVGGGTFKAPAAADPSISSSATLALNTGTSSLRYYDGTAERALYAEQEKSFTIASTTWNGIAGATASSSIPVGQASIHGETWTYLSCRTDTGTAELEAGDGVSWMDYQRLTSTAGLDSSLSNNTFTRLENRIVRVGQTASAPNFITCTVGVRPSAD